MIALFTWHTDSSLPGISFHCPFGTIPHASWFCCLLSWKAPSFERSTSFSRFIRKGDWEVNIYNFYRSGNILILPILLIDSLAGYRIFWLGFFSLRIFNTWFHCLLDFRVAVENLKLFWFLSLLCQLFQENSLCRNIWAGAWIVWRDELVLEIVWEVAVLVPYGSVTYYHKLGKTT